MAQYPIKNTETGEKKVIKMSVNDIMDWYKANPTWIRDWGEGCASLGEVGEMQDRIIKSHPSWGEVLKKVKKSGGSKSQIQI